MGNNAINLLLSNTSRILYLRSNSLLLWWIIPFLSFLLAGWTFRKTDQLLQVWAYAIGIVHDLHLCHCGFMNPLCWYWDGQWHKLDDFNWQSFCLIDCLVFLWWMLSYGSLAHKTQIFTFYYQYNRFINIISTPDLLPIIQSFSLQLPN